VSRRIRRLCPSTCIASLRSGAAGASNGTGSVVGLDASLGMLEVARAKVGCRVKCLWF
jgi:ubiquinone/menaquinone biosynthesis C-methylase UbiE